MEHRGSREAFRSAHCLPFIPPVYGLLPGTRDQTTDLVSPCPGGPVVNQVLCTWYLVTTNKPVCFGTEKKNGSWIIIANGVSVPLPPSGALALAHTSSALPFPIPRNGDHRRVVVNGLAS
ncbi:hypothetical protein VTN96DRAFT_9593 [Rasamsonia emersonii]